MPDLAQQFDNAVARTARAEGAGVLAINELAAFIAEHVAQLSGCSATRAQSVGLAMAMNMVGRLPDIVYGTTERQISGIAGSAVLAFTRAPQFRNAVVDAIRAEYPNVSA